VASLPPSENLALRGAAQRLLGVTFLPAVAERTVKKKEAGSRRSRNGATHDTTPDPASPIFAA